MKKILCHKIRINNGGYDSTGYYYGSGAPVYYIEWNFESCGMIFCDSTNVRAMSRKDALEIWHQNYIGTSHAMKNSIGRL